MNKIILRTCSLMFACALTGTTVTFLAGCNPEPDESDLFTATGETVADYLKRKPELSSFNYILSRTGLDRNLAAYGEYTCFAPNNEAVAAYVDKLYNDEEAKTPHNGMTENSLEGLNDSLCSAIALYHIHAGDKYTTISMGGGAGSINTMLRVPFSTDGSTGKLVLNEVSTIIAADSVVTNGVVHVIDSVIPRNTRLLPEQLERIPEFSIFTEALKLTHLDDSIKTYKKDREYTITDYKDTDGKVLYHPEECLVKYTVFAETDAVMRQNGINNIDDLIEKAKEWYKDAAAWYDLPDGVTISTGDDYTNRFNTLNMFVAYHLLYAGMAQDEMVYERSSKWLASPQTWNYVNGGQPYDYYETMLPNTLVKIWQPKPYDAKKTLYINRYITFNTLTDELGTMGSEQLHQQVEGLGLNVRINRSSDKSADNPPVNVTTYNGYIHSIQGMLVYTEQVPKGVLHERLRFDSTTFLVEFINNRIRYTRSSEFATMAESGARVAFPLDWFDNVRSYTSKNRFRYNVKGAYNAYQSDTFQGWGDYDLAIKLPPVPSGDYEFRIFYTPMSHGGMMQFYMGNSSNLNSMMALDIPLDVRIPITDPRIGSTHFYEEEDLGVATDAALRNRGYMRGLFCYVDHPEYNDGNATEHNQRSDLRNASLRKIMGRMKLKQNDEHWFRIKNVISTETDLKWQFDYIEFVPLDVVDNPNYSEDWF